MSLYTLIYASTAVTRLSDDQLAGILRSSRTNNTRAEVSGMLVYKNGEFMQVLEGERTAVQTTHARIAGDPRHRDLITILEEYIPERTFSDWSMGFCNLDESSSFEIPGYSDFLNTPLTGREFSADPSLAQRMLLSFKQKGWLAT